MSGSAKQQIWNDESVSTMNDKRTTISMNNTFYSNQPAQDTANELRFYQAQFAK
jgi:hypothetical protein